MDKVGQQQTSRMIPTSTLLKIHAVCSEAEFVQSEHPLQMSSPRFRKKAFRQNHAARIQHACIPFKLLDL